MDKLNIFSIDHGNESNKTPFSTFNCGLTKHEGVPPMVENWIKYEGRYYALSDVPQKYTKDKTVDENYIVYTLFALAFEEKKGNINLNKGIHLSVGLPPLHILTLRKKYEEYLLNSLRNCSFEFNGVEKKVNVVDVNVYPQGYAAAMAYRPRRKANGILEVKSPLLKSQKRYLLIDIGGMTVDFIYFDNNRPFLEKSNTRAIGVITMSDTIARKVLLETGYEVSRRDIEAVIKKEPHVYPDELVDFIINETQEWAKRILSEVGDIVPDLRLIPIIFVGGGSILLEEYIRQLDGLPKNVEIIKDQRANAKGYAEFVKHKLLKEKVGV